MKLRRALASPNFLEHRRIVAQSVRVTVNVQVAWLALVRNALILVLEPVEPMLNAA